MRGFVLGVTALVGAFAAGCSSSSGGGGGSEEGGAGEGEALEASAGDDAGGFEAGGGCNTLENTAPTLTVQQVAQDPPAPEGGAVADGIYEMTDVDIYTGTGGPTGASGSTQTTIQISGGTVQVVSSGNPATRTTTLVTSGTTFTATDTCPDTSVETGGYTATAKTFVLQLPGGQDEAGARTLVETFTKQ